MKSKYIVTTGALGDKLTARIDSAEGDKQRVSLLAHCFTSSKELKAIGHITKSLIDRYISTLRVNFKGYGHSDSESGFQ